MMSSCQARAVIQTRKDSRALQARALSACACTCKHMLELVSCLCFNLLAYRFLSQGSHPSHTAPARCEATGGRAVRAREQ